MKNVHIFHWTEKHEGIILPEERLPWGGSILMGLQHVLAMFGATVLAPIIMGFDPNICLFFSGIGTIVFFLCVGGRVPSYLGSSFAFIGPVLSVTKTGSIEAALGGIMAAGFVYAVTGLLVMKAGYRWIDAIMPPVVTGSVVMIIGLNLAGAAKTLFMQGPLPGIITLASALTIAVYSRGFASRLPVLLGCLVGYMAAFLMGKVDLTAVWNAPWFGLPPFRTPLFDLHAVSAKMSSQIIIQRAFCMNNRIEDLFVNDLLTC